MMALMLVGAVGALLPMIDRNAIGCRLRVAHGGMLAAMAAMVIYGMETWLALASTITLVALALYVTTEASERSRGIPCAVDLTAMAVLFMLVPSVGAHSRAAMSEPMPQPMHHGSSVDARMFAVVVLGCWAAATFGIARRKSTGKPATIGSALMVLGMTPVVL